MLYLACSLPFENYNHPAIIFQIKTQCCFWEILFAHCDFNTTCLVKVHDVWTEFLIAYQLFWHALECVLGLFLSVEAIVDAVGSFISIFLFYYKYLYVSLDVPLNWVEQAFFKGKRITLECKSTFFQLICFGHFGSYTDF